MEEDDQEEAPKPLDLNCGAHFMYKELFKRLSDMDKPDKTKGKNYTTKINK